MRYMALAADFDGTLAHDSKVEPSTIASLLALRRSGRRLVLVTGRTLRELLGDLPQETLFDLVVAENGGLLYDPQSKREDVLGPPASQKLVAELRRRGVSPLGVGRVIVATWEPHEETVVDTIASLGLEMQIIFNKGAVMVLPSGTNKATGLKAAFDRLELSLHNAVGVGDAENDHAFLMACECSAAVANALPSLKAEADIVLHGDHGAGVAELIGAIVADDLASVPDRRGTRRILLGKGAGEEQWVDGYAGGTTLIVGASGEGKSTLVLGLIERIIGAGYQVCVIDPEGDYESFGELLVLGDADHTPALDEIDQVLRKPAQSIAVNLLGMTIDDRPQFFGELMGRLMGLRNRAGRPHWIVLDEAHHLVPPESDFAIPHDVHGIMAVTTDARKVSHVVRDAASAIIAVGEDRSRLLREAVPSLDGDGAAHPDERSNAAIWRKDGGSIAAFAAIEPTTAKRRHRRKYATGDLKDEKSFYFTGPHERLHLQANNLATFVRMAQGVDDETWLYHLRRGDYARWFEHMIGDCELAGAAEKARSDDAQESRRKILEAIERRYTAP